MGRRTCIHEGCSKAPSFGFPGEERVTCSAHKRPGQEYLPGKAEHKRGAAGDSLTQAMGHVPRGLDIGHATDRRHEARHHGIEAGGDGKHCQEAGCLKAPSYGWGGAAVMCALHKRPAMVYLRHASASSSTTASGTGIAAADGKASAEKGHIPRGLEYIPSVTMDSDRVVHSDHPHCAYKGCTKAPSYGTEGQGGTFCFSHKRPGQVFLRRGATPAAPLAPSASAEAKNSSSTARSDHPKEVASADIQQHDTEKAGVAVDADMAEARRCIAVARQHVEDVTIGVKYLSMIHKHPDIVKYRTLKISNRKFYTEVWLNSGMRGIFLSLGFRKRENGTVVLDPLAPNTLDCTAAVLKELSTPP